MINKIGQISKQKTTQRDNKKDTINGDKGNKISEKDKVVKISKQNQTNNHEKPLNNQLIAIASIIETQFSLFIINYYNQQNHSNIKSKQHQNQIEKQNQNQNKQSKLNQQLFSLYQKQKYLFRDQLKQGNKQQFYESINRQQVQMIRIDEVKDLLKIHKNKYFKNQFYRSVLTTNKQSQIKKINQEQKSKIQVKIQNITDQQCYSNKNNNENNKSNTDDSNQIEGDIDNIDQSVDDNDQSVDDNIDQSVDNNDQSVFDIGGSMSLIRVNKNNGLLSRQEQEQDDKCRQIVVNPSLTLLTQYLLTIYQNTTNNKNNRGYSYQQNIKDSNNVSLFSLNPSHIVLSSSNIHTVISTIIFRHFLLNQQNKQNKYQSQNTPSSSQQQQSKQNLVPYLITTQDIFPHYLSILKFTQLIKSFLTLLIPTIFNSNNSNSFNKQTLYSQYLQLVSQKQSYIQNKLKHLLCSVSNIYIGKAQRIIKIQNIQILLRCGNIFLYPTYDVQIYHNQTQLIGLIECQSLSNVQNLYYSYKKGFIQQSTYLNTIKRLQHKSTLLNHYNTIIFKKQNHHHSSSKKSITKTQKLPQQQPQQINTKYTNSLIKTNLYLSKTNPQLSIKTAHIPLQSLSKPYHIKKTSLLTPSNQSPPSPHTLYTDTNSISVEDKIALFTLLRTIQLLTLLSDTDIRALLDDSLLIDLKEKQILHNNSMRMEYIYIILKGSIKVTNHMLQNQNQTLTKGKIFGYHTFLLKKHQQIQKNNQQQNNNTQKISFNQTIKQSICQNNLYQINQNQSTLTVLSPKAKVLRISFNHLTFILSHQLTIITKSFFSHSQQSNTKNIQNIQNTSNTLNTLNITHFLSQVLGKYTLQTQIKRESENQQQQSKLNQQFKKIKKMFSYYKQNSSYLLNLISHSQLIQSLQKLRSKLQNQPYKSQTESLNLFNHLLPLKILFQNYPNSILLF